MTIKGSQENKPEQEEKAVDESIDQSGVDGNQNSDQKEKEEGSDRDLNKNKKLNKKNALIVAVAVFVLVLIGGTITGLSYYFRYFKQISPEAVLPGDVDIVSKVNMDMKSEQYQLLDIHLRKFPGYKLIEKELDKTGKGKKISEFIQDKLREKGLSYQEDVAAVLENEAYVVIPDVTVIGSNLKKRVSYYYQRNFGDFIDGKISLARNNFYAFLKEPFSEEDKSLLAGINFKEKFFGNSRSSESLAMNGATTDGVVIKQDNQTKVLGKTSDYYSGVSSLESLDFIMASKVKDLKKAKQVLNKLSTKVSDYEVEKLKYKRYLYFKVRALNTETGSLVDVGETYHTLLGGNWVMTTKEDYLKRAIDQKRKSDLSAFLTKGKVEISLAENVNFQGTLNDLKEAGEEVLLAVYSNLDLNRLATGQGGGGSGENFIKYPDSLITGFTIKITNDGIAVKNISNQVSLREIKNVSFKHGLVQHIPSKINGKWADFYFEYANPRDLYYSFKKNNLTDSGLKFWKSKIAELAGDFKVHIETDLIDQLRGEVAVVGFFNAGEVPEGALIAKVESPERVLMAARKIIEIAKEAYLAFAVQSAMGMDFSENADLGAIMRQMEAKRSQLLKGMKLQEKETEFGTLYSFHIPETEFFFDFGFADDKFILGTHRTTVTGLMKEFTMNGSEKLVDSANYQAIARNVYPDGFSKAFVNTKGAWNGFEYYFKKSKEKDLLSGKKKTVPAEDLTPMRGQQDKLEEDAMFAISSLIKTINVIGGSQSMADTKKNSKSSLFVGVKELPVAEKNRAELIIERVSSF